MKYENLINSHIHCYHLTQTTSPKLKTSHQTVVRNTLSFVFDKQKKAYTQKIEHLKRKKAQPKQYANDGVPKPQFPLTY